MKCGKCNEKEAVFHLSSDINGEKSELHLCAECAAAEGYGDYFKTRSMRLLDNFFRDPFEDMFSGFFGSDSLFGSFERSLFAPMLTLPRVGLRARRAPAAEKTEEKKAEKTEEKIPEAAERELVARRELAALKHSLQEAVQAEDFEKAIELRDKIRTMEA